MKVHELNTGILIEHDGRSVATVETGRNTIEITVRRGGQRAFAASRAGMRAALDLLTRYTHFVPKQTRPDHGRGAQADLFSSARHRPRDVGEHELEQLLLGALRRAAARDADEIDTIEGAVAKERPTPLIFSRAVIDAAYFERDVVRFRPAAIAAAFIETLPVATETPESADALRPLVDQWRGLFSPTGSASRALNKTLEDLWPSAAASDVWDLRRVHLERPVRSPLHLRLLAERARCRERHRNEHLALLQHADEHELADLLDRVTTSLHLENLPTKEREHLFAELVSEAGAADAHVGLRALVGRAIVSERANRRTDGMNPDDLTTPPLVPPPPCARFLATVGEIIREGEVMHHCVGTRARSAVAGDAFLFHIEFDGQQATCEVNAHGDVVEVSGRCNESNSATEYGEKLLRAWGARLYAAHQSQAAIPSRREGSS